ncbi:MAG TPA: N-acetylmuramoyl-L-alanine amidase [Bryobacteraceae bacterium]|nr:N-acetylmuramoyl-L-alanine amidase [Bryobacteraceae bacterium]
MKTPAALVVFALISAAQTERGPLNSVTAVRHWSTADVTRVAVEVTGSFLFRTDRLHGPERVYFDILDAIPHINSRRSYTENLDDVLLKRIRVAETAPGVTRVVLDVADGAEVHTSQLANPNRLIVELRMGGGPATATPPTQPVAVPQPEPPKLAPPPSIKAAAAPPVLPAAVTAPVTPPVLPAASHADARSVSATIPVTEPALKPSIEPAKIADAIKKPSAAPDPSAAAPKAARHTSSGDTSLVRALGLKIQRVVIDPGHGGHDHGTEGPHGLLEKDLVLDVAQRLGKLIEDRMGAEVIYTRTDDTFIPLEGRTALANEKKADLFLSIHANSSSLPRITGVETYYLSLTDSKEAKDVAARENDASQLSVFELRDLIQKITLNDKAEESKEFAGRIQTALYAFSARSFPTERNRGVKKAPFVVLIGAQMPSVLAEIGFVSNTREEALLKKPDYRQRLAEALFRGVSRYADGLSHFQVAQNAK